MAGGLWSKTYQGSIGRWRAKKEKAEKEAITRRCLECCAEFTTKRSKKKFCSSQCRFKNWEKLNPRVRASSS